MAESCIGLLVEFMRAISLPALQTNPPSYVMIAEWPRWWRQSSSQHSEGAVVVLNMVLNMVLEIYLEAPM